MFRPAQPQIPVTYMYCACYPQGPSLLSNLVLFWLFLCAFRHCNRLCKYKATGTLSSTSFFSWLEAAVVLNEMKLPKIPLF